MNRILITDDDKTTLSITRRILEKNGYDVTAAYTGDECIELLKSSSFDLLIMDIELEGETGIEVLDRIRKTPEIKDIKTVFLTASSQRGDMTDALRLGALDFLTRPVLPEDLIKVINNTINLGDAKYSILVVDDEIMNLMATEELFGIRYNVKTATSGAEALASIEEHVPDLVLLDLHMPGMDGLEVLNRIRSMKGCRTLPVVFLSADTDADTEVEMFKAGAMDFIAKPFIKQVAMQRIVHALQLKKLQDSLQDQVDRKTSALRESNRKIRSLSEQVIWALAGSIDAKDHYTNGHSNRVANYARELARRMNKTEAEQEDIYNIALLHDVGKVSIPENIINKPGKLTEDEYNVIKSHTVKGYEILKTISEMPDLSIGARWHHERYDGSGYPDGKRGEEIPEIARIICVADCYDAMTTDRIYRCALPKETVRSELINCSGTQFDPKIAELMIEIMDDEAKGGS